MLEVFILVLLTLIPDGSGMDGKVERYKTLQECQEVRAEIVQELKGIDPDLYHLTECFKLKLVKKST